LYSINEIAHNLRADQAEAYAAEQKYGQQQKRELLSFDVFAENFVVPP
jgi:hypothetical protein